MGNYEEIEKEFQLRFNSQDNYYHYEDDEEDEI